MTTYLTLAPSNSHEASHEGPVRRQEWRDTYLAVQMEACLVATPSHESIVDFAFYKAGQIALLLKDKSRVSHGGSTNCRLVIFSLSDVPFMLLDRYSNGTNQLSQHVFEVSKLQHARCIPGRQAVMMRPVQSALQHQALRESADRCLTEHDIYVMLSAGTRTRDMSPSVFAVTQSCILLISQLCFTVLSVSDCTLPAPSCCHSCDWEKQSDMSA